MRLFAFGLLLAIFGLFSCKKTILKKGAPPPDNGSQPTLTAEKPLLKLWTGPEVGLDFINHIEETFENNPTTNINIYNGGGIAVADVNNDGLPDIYLVGANGPNKLFINQTKTGGGIHFRDATAGSGLESPEGFESAVTAVDINADGWMDFYVCLAGPYEPAKTRNKLFINNKNGSFSEKAAEYGIDCDSKSESAAFFDYDLDGDLDLYVVNYIGVFDYISKMESNIDPVSKKRVAVTEPKTPGDSDRLYRNEGNGKFTDVSKKAGINNFAYGLSVAIADFNNDYYPDIYVGNDFIQPDFLYINQKNGTFKNELDKYVTHTAQHTMGVDMADIDNDLHTDFLGVDMLPHDRSRLKATLNTNSQTNYNQRIDNGYFEPVVRNVLQHSNGIDPTTGHPTFSDIACLAGVYNTDWSWSGLFMDLDNDTYKDLCITNGYRHEVNDVDFFTYTIADIISKPYRETFTTVDEFIKILPSFKMRNYIFKNKGDLTFENMNGNWATVPGSFSSGAVWADFDRDGDLDWAVSNLDETPFLYENLQNQQPDNHFLQIKCLGIGQNLQAVGAKAWLETPDGQTQTLDLQPTRGMFSSVEHLFHFGLGKNATVKKLTIRWPDGKATIVENVPANQRLELKWADANAKFTAPPAEKSLFLQKNAVAAGLNFQHVENKFSDFDREFLIPWKLSELGPTLAAGDVNGDNLDDFFVGNAFDSPGALFLQTASGSFRRGSEGTFFTDKIYEDTGAKFFDADGDGDLDLVVTSGGHEATSAIAWQPRLYINDGKGNFSRKMDGFPVISTEMQAIAANDLDGDGDLDICLGGRLSKIYGDPGRSMILKNEGGKFVDATVQMAGDFEKTGMVTDLEWANLDADPALELIATGEWMPVSIFKFSGGKMVNATAQFGLENSNGLWQSLTVADLNGDGKLDLLTGNFGKNTRLSASEKQPLQLFYQDFDGNGSVEPVMTMFEPDGQRYPTARQDVMLKQLPVLKKDFLFARAYGNATYEKLFAKHKAESAKMVKANTLATTWWENQGGRFVAHELPVLAQTSLVFGSIVQDLTGDGIVDIFVCGNKYGIEVETGRCDASVGCLLVGDGKGGYSPISAAKSGILANREARGVVALRGSGGKTLLVVANNSDGLQLFSK